MVTQSIASDGARHALGPTPKHTMKGGATCSHVLPTSPQSFYILGHNIFHSLSPALHNAGFHALGLPHRYEIHESEAVDATVEELLKRPDFGGASVTFPHKLQISSLLDSQTESAEKVGAINTITVKYVSSPHDGGPVRHFQGSNTDWIGIQRCIQRSTAADFRVSTGLVLGAGGAARAGCYALQMLGIGRVVIVNRTTSKALDMASHFPEMQSQVFPTLEEAAVISANETMPIRFIVACIPADDLGEEKIPEGLFKGSETGVLVEMAYRPQITGMIAMAQRHPGWKVARGIDVLEEQAYEQFEMWTGQPAPVVVMREAMQERLREKS